MYYHLQMLGSPLRVFCHLGIVLHILRHPAIFRHHDHATYPRPIRLHRWHHLRVCRFRGHALYHCTKTLRIYLRPHESEYHAHSPDHSSTGRRTCCRLARPAVHSRPSYRAAAHLCRLRHYLGLLGRSFVSNYYSSFHS